MVTTERFLRQAVVETVEESEPHGAPGGVLYMALMQVGYSFDQFQSLMAGLVRDGVVRLEGQLYHTVLVQ